MNAIEKIKTEYNALGSGAKLLNNSLYALTLAVSLYPSGVYDAYYRNYVKSRVVQKLTFPSEINAEGIFSLATASAASMPATSASGMRVSIPIQDFCDGVMCQIGVVLCTSSKDNFNACAQVMASSISQ